MLRPSRCAVNDLPVADAALPPVSTSLANAMACAALAVGSSLACLFLFLYRLLRRWLFRSLIRLCLLASLKRLLARRRSLSFFCRN